MTFVYLASTYSSPDAAIRHQRFIAACRAAGRLMEQGYVIFSPIAHSHSVSETMDGKHLDFDFWMRQDLPILAHASRLIVLQLDGWRESRGVTQEIEFARDNGIPVEYMDPVILEPDES